VFTASTTQETAITTANVNVRSAPSLTASIIRIVPSGILGTIIDGPVDADGYRWWKVFYASYGVTGWTADNWLKRTGEYQSDFVTATANLNVRSGPSLSAPVIGAVRAETHGIIVDGPVTADGYRWWKINFPGYDLVGWSADNWLERSEFTNIIPSSAEFKIGARVYNTFLLILLPVKK